MSAVWLAPVTPENWRTPLAVAPQQKEQVADRITLLARAFAYRNSRSRAYFIMHEDVPLGMALYYDLPQREAYVLSELFIDTRYQRMGYGTAATAALLAQMRADGRWRRVLLCYIEGNDAARGLYASFGFAENGARDQDEIEMELTL